jgi:tRNA uridine 5-carboxymethylaminomethyl modification enzyme
LATQRRVSIVEATVGSLAFAPGGAVAGIRALDGSLLTARSVVIATGTFLRGCIYIGTQSRAAGGRAGESPSTELASQLMSLGLTTGRFKTGTPPRIDGRTVSFDTLERQDSELEAFAYRWSRVGPPAPPLEQVPCWLTWAGDATKEVVSKNLDQSAMYGGAIGARGPRYCPSIEDKVVRFPLAPRHQVFLEPEGLDTAEMYVNGLSTSLPVAVQIEMLRSVPGLSRVEMTRPGYAIEYDYFAPTGLYPWLECRAVPGLFFAGQVNGTTGYEEAAAQGVVAGLNAGLQVSDRAPVTLGRETSYIGVLVDDLVTKGVDEPYRLFTSRSEFRLTVRHDNAVRRLTAIGKQLGLYNDAELRRIDERLSCEEELIARAEQVSVPPEVVQPVLAAAGSTPLRHAVRASELARRVGVGLADVLRAAGERIPDDEEAAISADLEIKYAGYFARERAAAERLRLLGSYQLGNNTEYLAMTSLSTESREKLQRHQPATLAQAASIPGISPADLQNLVLEMERRRAVLRPATLM